jgi:hypothetical protein
LKSENTLREVDVFGRKGVGTINQASDFTFFSGFGVMGRKCRRGRWKNPDEKK